MDVPEINLPRIVVIGAGFAGLQIALGVNSDDYQVILLDKNNYHLFQPLLYQVASAGLEPDSIAYPIRKTLHNKKNTYYRLAEVIDIDKENSTVTTNIGDLKYDHLIISSGATNNYFGNKTIEANSMPMKSLTDALNLRSKILGNFETALNTKDLSKREELMNIVIVGAGPTGIELAGSLSELKNKVLPKDFPDLDFRQMQIHLVEAAPRVLSAMSETSSKKVNGYLKSLGVNVWLGMLVTNYENNLVTTNSDTVFKADTLIWSAGVAGNIPTGIEKENYGRGNRIIIDDFCKMKTSKNIYAVGDAALIQSEKYPNGLPMLGSVAMQQGKYLGDYFNKLSSNKKLKPFVYNDKGTMATVGRNLAVVEMGKLKFQGFLAWMAWMVVHLMLLVGFRNRVVVFINWAWNYIQFNNNGLRLIIRPYKKKE